MPCIFYSLFACLILYTIFNKHNRNGEYVEGERIYGVGVAFSEIVIDFQGKRQEQVGWVAFIQYLNKMIPIWMNDDGDN